MAVCPTGGSAVSHRLCTRQASQRHLFIVFSSLAQRPSRCQLIVGGTPRAVGIPDPLRHSQAHLIQIGVGGFERSLRAAEPRPAELETENAGVAIGDAEAIARRNSVPRTRSAHAEIFGIPGMTTAAYAWQPPAPRPRAYDQPALLPNTRFTALQLRNRYSWHEKYAIPSLQTPTNSGARVTTPTLCNTNN